jgi:hypothetical protein
MGIVLVLSFWLIVGVVLATLGAGVFAAAAAILTRGSPERRGMIIAAASFPFMCLAWAGMVFIFQGIVNEAVLHRDAGIGDSWRCPLPNGYELLMIDVMDQGTVYNPSTQQSGGVAEQEDAVSGVRRVQVAGPYILGGADSQWFEHLSEESDQTDSFFLLDTRTGKRASFASVDELQNAALQRQIRMNLKPIAAVYSRYRFSSFDVLAGLVLCVPPLVRGGMLVRRIRKARQIG